MLAVERRRLIQDLINEKKSVSVSELSRRFDVTDETIRRDLKHLEEEGNLIRTYGGAFIQSGVENAIDVKLRKSVYISEKETIAMRCRSLVDNGDTIFLDNSTTCLHIAKALGDMQITVVTNNLMIINLFSTSENIRLVSIGGQFDRAEQAFYGTIAIKTLCQHYFDKAFISCRTLSLENGITESTDRWADLRHVVTERSDKRYLVADHTKFGQTSFVKIGGFDRFTAIITDKLLDEVWHEAILKYGCEIIDGTVEHPLMKSS